MVGVELALVVVDGAGAVGRTGATRTCSGGRDGIGAAAAVGRPTGYRGRAVGDSRAVIES